MGKFRIIAATVGALLLGAGFFVTQAQDPPTEDVAATAQDRPEMPVSDPSCTFFGPGREKMLSRIPRRAAMTAQVATQVAPAGDVMQAYALAASALPSAPGGSRTDTLQRVSSSNNIDKYIFEALATAGMNPAPPTTDFEFVRRVYLDLTGRIPSAGDVTAFVNDSDPSKRSKLVDALVGSPNWIDKWTVWYGDLLKNNSRNTQIVRYLPGVMAFNDFIRNSLAANKPYNQMAREMIAATGTDSYTQGELNFVVGGVMGGGPVQDIFDAQIASAAETFLGVSHLNCLLCHNGRGHLDQLSLWGYYATRQDAWGMASFMSHTYTSRTPIAGATGGNPYYWSLTNNVSVRGYNYTLDYPLNTQTGNRPARGALNSTVRVKPAYIFDGTSPASGQDYRTFLAQKMTSDFQFARAAVNYMWEYFFEIGLVSPSNQFDPDRLDPDHPPANCPPNAPCTLQASNPRLLNALAQDFVLSGYDIRALQKEIVNSRAYQLSSRYEGTWNPANANLFGRKLVRRLWSEEIHDSVAQSSNIVPSYPGALAAVNGSPYTAWGPVNWAMKFPEPSNTPNGGGATNVGASVAFLDAFLRGNRDDQERDGEGSIPQALAMMNDTFIMNRVRSNAATGLMQTSLKLPDDQLVANLYLTVLSRYPTQTELGAALANLKTNRTQEAQNLLWSLYNSVSFTFNY